MSPVNTASHSIFHSILTQLSNHIIIIVTSLFAALIGGLLTGYFSLRQVKIAQKNNLEIKRLEEEELINNFKRSIYQEIKTLSNLYYGDDNDEHNEAVGKIINKLENPSEDFVNYFKNVLNLLNEDIENKPTYPNISEKTYVAIYELFSKLPNFIFNYYYPISQNYFVVYEKNVQLIGKIKDDILGSTIIECYTMMKGLLDSFALNNGLVAKLENFQLALDKNKNVVDAKVILTTIKSLYDYSNKLKFTQQKLKGKIISDENSLLKLLENDLNN
jgi:hypothetical protein